ncbi:MAG: cytochrome c [Flavobacteriia bacterium]|nr:cytochrome c [Flavobacteriia bacterium]
MKYKLPVLLLFALVLSRVLLVACAKDKVPVPVNVAINPCPDTISFANDVLPIMNDAACTYCHGPGCGIGEYYDYTTISNSAQQILNSIGPNGTMPQGGTKLADSTVQKIACWISQGKKNN